MRVTSTLLHKCMATHGFVCYVFGGSHQTPNDTKDEGLANGNVVVVV